MRKLFHKHQFIIKLHDGPAHLECLHCLKKKTIPDVLTQASGAFTLKKRLQAQKEYRAHYAEFAKKLDQENDDLEIWFQRQKSGEEQP